MNLDLNKFKVKRRKKLAFNKKERIKIHKFDQCYIINLNHMRNFIFITPESHDDATDDI